MRGRGFEDQLDCFVQVVCHAVEVTGLEPAFDACGIDLDAKKGSPNASWFALERADPENFARPETKIALQQFNQINVLGGIEFCSPSGQKALAEAREELNRVQAIPDRPGELDVSVWWDGETWRKPVREVDVIQLPAQPTRLPEK